MSNPIYEVTVKLDGKKIRVYKQSSTGNWINYEDCKTTYSKNELQGLPDNA